MKFLYFFLVLFLITGCQEKTADQSTDQMKNNTPNQSHQKSPFQVFEPQMDTQMFEHKQQFTESFKIYETLGSGVAVIDINNDGQFELFFAQFDLDHKHTHPSSVMYQKNGQSYLDITSSVGLSELNNIMGAAVADFNNDGWSDLLVYGHQTLHMMINKQGQFENLDMTPFINDNFYTSATFLHANNDEWLDLWLSTYVQVETDKEVICKNSDGRRSYCKPSAYSYQKDILLMNNQGQSFSMADNDIISIKASPALGVVAADFNQDGLTDIYVANDAEQNFLFSQMPNGTFIEQGQLKGAAANLAGLSEASMGIAIADYDNNGLLDLFLTHIDGESNTLYKNEQKWFSDVTNNTGLGSNNRPLTGFGTGFYDLSGDNWPDLFVANGRIQAKPYQHSDDLIEQFSEKPLLYINRKGMFENIEQFSNLPIKGIGRGLAFVDLDNDGDKDVIISNNNQKPTFLNNQLNPKKWIGLSLNCQQRSPIGAELTFVIDNDQMFYRHIHTDGSYASANDPRIIIYLNDDQQLTSLQIEHYSQQQQVDLNSLEKNQYNSLRCR